MHAITVAKRGDGALGCGSRCDYLWRNRRDHLWPAKQVKLPWKAMRLLRLRLADKRLGNGDGQMRGGRVFDRIEPVSIPRKAHVSLRLTLPDLAIFLQPCEPQAVINEFFRLDQ